MPMEARGLFSGVLQQGYSLGYLIAAIFNLYVVPNSAQSWKALFFIGAGLTLCVAIARVLFPESRQFIEAKRSGEQATGRKKVKLFWQDGKSIMKEYWKRAVYAVVMMGINSNASFLSQPSTNIERTALFNFMSHTSQDMYPTYMQQTKGFTPQMSSKATIIANTGALIGGTVTALPS